ncbi:MAG: hypothetical protein KC419_04295 [Anaerolineales bacterium]|nr:hypothetical protein [Anaerolineales bacterium]MCA9927667.1 hypothetical protein [Anaerolineales bacterium]
MNDDINELKEAEKKASEHGAEWEEPVSSTTATSRHRSKNWGAGLVLIAIGTIFLISNTTDFHLDNWWALFILIPAFSNFGSALNNYRNNGRLTRSGRGSVTGGLILSLIASVFLFDLDWGYVWPLFLIIGGLSALLGGWFD